MTQIELLALLKELIVETAAKAHPGRKEEFAKMQTLIESKVTLDAPLATLGWDSLQFTWLLVAVEERLKIDTSTISLFDLFTVEDLLKELQMLINNGNENQYDRLQANRCTAELA